ncbi:YfzA family protein [Paenibacillus sp. N3/727]|uniref:YfzA family protein n=1 Tax=Paenibacillus sp. N3/727 TaxID=2925845 RepID=UPI001F531F30|nr:YfzA family protein [Paenibacillus sp. N3/727]UNK17911.1 YfzA family protein [Paenibacillus sp. N3/727]
MTDKRKKDHPNRIRSWVITLGVFLIVQLIFIAVDGTSLEPNINDSGNLWGRILQSELFTEWITPYSFPFFNLCTVVCVIAILAKAVTDIFSSIKNKLKCL